MRSALIVDCGSRKVDAIVEIVTNRGWETRRRPFSEVAENDFGDCQAVVISGGPHLFTTADEDQAAALRGNFAWLTAVRIPVFGICLGHQAIALDAGGEVFRGSERRESDVVRFTDDHPILAGLETGTTFAEDHCEGATLPAGFRLLGVSDHYEVEIMANDEAKHYGVQFHPEISGAPGERLIANFLDHSISSC